MLFLWLYCGSGGFIIQHVRISAFVMRYRYYVDYCCRSELKVVAIDNELKVSNPKEQGCFLQLYKFKVEL